MDLNTLFSSIYNGTITNVFYVFSFGLLTNIVAWYLTKEKRSKVRLYYRISGNKIILAIQNNSSNYLENNCFLDYKKVFFFSKTIQIKYEIIQGKDSKISFNDNLYIAIDYINKKSSAVIIITVNQAIEFYSDTIQKGYANKIELIHENRPSGFTPFVIIKTLFNKYYYLINLVIMPPLYAYVLVNDFFKQKITFYHIIIHISFITVYLFMIWKYYKKPKKILNMWKYYKKII